MEISPQQYDLQPDNIQQLKHQQQEQWRQQRRPRGSSGNGHAAAAVVAPPCVAGVAVVGSSVRAPPANSGVANSSSPQLRPRQHPGSHPVSHHHHRTSGLEEITEDPRPEAGPLLPLPPHPPPPSSADAQPSMPPPLPAHRGASAVPVPTMRELLRVPSTGRPGAYKRILLFGGVVRVAEPGADLPVEPGALERSMTALRYVALGSAMHGSGLNSTPAVGSSRNSGRTIIGDCSGSGNGVPGGASNSSNQQQQHCHQNQHQRPPCVSTSPDYCDHVKAAGLRVACIVLGNYDALQQARRQGLIAIVGRVLEDSFAVTSGGRVAPLQQAQLGRLVDALWLFLWHCLRRDPRGAMEDLCAARVVEWFVLTLTGCPQPAGRVWAGHLLTRLSQWAHISRPVTATFCELYPLLLQADPRAFRSPEGQMFMLRLTHTAVEWRGPGFMARHLGSLAGFCRRLAIVINGGDGGGGGNTAAPGRGTAQQRQRRRRRLEEAAAAAKHRGSSGSGSGSGSGKGGGRAGGEREGGDGGDVWGGGEGAGRADGSGSMAALLEYLAVTVLLHQVAPTAAGRAALQRMDVRLALGELEQAAEAASQRRVSGAVAAMGALPLYERGALFEAGWWWPSTASSASPASPSSPSSSPVAGMAAAAAAR